MNFKKWIQLQQKLKEQFIITQSQFQQKNNFQKRLNASILDYFSNYIQLLQQKQIKADSQKKILKDDGFGDAYTFVKQVVLTLSKDVNIMQEIIKKNDENWSQRWKIISKLIVNNLYQNIVEQEIYYKDVMILIVSLLQIIINQTKKPVEISFSSPNVSSKILREFTHRQQIKNYSNFVLKSTLLAISKVDTPLDLQIQNIQIKAKNVKENPVKTQQKLVSVPSLILTISDIQNSTKFYSSIFKQYDMNKGYTDPKGQPYMSKNLLKFLGVSDQTSYPSFKSKKERKQNVEEQIHQKFSKIIDKSSMFEKQIKPNEQIEENITKIKNIINTFFSSIFKNIYNLPLSIRVICKLIQILIVKKFPNISRNLIINSVSNFLFTTWLLPQIQYHEKVIATGYIKQHNTKNASIIQHLIQKILKNEYTTQNVSYKKQLNQLIKRLKYSIQNYIEQVLNLTDSRINLLLNRKKQQRISSYTVCLNYQELKILFDLILESKLEISKINQKIINRVIRVRDMTDDFQVLKGKFDKEDNKFYNSQQAYALFIELNLPKLLQTDYYKAYIQTYKNNKQKNLLRQILISTESIQMTPSTSFKDMKQYLQYLESKYKYKKQLNSFDKIPVSLKIKYLLSLKNCNLEEISDEIKIEYENRIQATWKMFNETKLQFLKARESVTKYRQVVSQSQLKVNTMKKKKKLQQFFQKTKINVCLTSPKTREALIVMKTNSSKNLGPEKQKIWLEFQTTCIHTSLNLQFIKSLTGTTEEKKKDQPGHCNDIRKFVDAFCQLPQVKHSIINGVDKIGIKQNFYEFIKFCVDLAKKQPVQNKLLLENQTWFEQQLQNILTRRIYERIYPKQQTYYDAAIYFRLKMLDWINFDHLNIPQKNRMQTMWKICANSLHQIQQFKTPAQKLQCMINCTQTMTNILSLTSEKDDPASADITYPLIIYILLKACPRRLYSNIHFVQIFSNSNKMMSGDGYCFIQIKSALSFFEILNHQKLTGISKIEYEKYIYEKQIQYGIYFLKKRPRSEKRAYDEKKLRQLINSYIN